MICCLIYKVILTRALVCCLFSLPAGVVKRIWSETTITLFLFSDTKLLMIIGRNKNKKSDVQGGGICSDYTWLRLEYIHCIYSFKANAHLSTIRSRVRLRRQSVRPFSPSSTSCWQEGHGNNMGGGAASFRLRPGYVPHTGRRTQMSWRWRRKRWVDM